MVRPSNKQKLSWFNVPEVSVLLIVSFDSGDVYIIPCMISSVAIIIVPDTFNVPNNSITPVPIRAIVEFSLTITS